MVLASARLEELDGLICTIGESFGVCGTGLKTEAYGNGTMGTYDKGAVWILLTLKQGKGILWH